MRMDAAYYEDLAGRLYGLLIGLDDRISSEQAQLLHHFIEVGEYGLALEEIAGTLAQDAIAITGQERRDMMALAAQMKLEADLVPLARRGGKGQPVSGSPAQRGGDGRVCDPARRVDPAEPVQDVTGGCGNLGNRG
jgi:hypothetical protein